MRFFLHVRCECGLRENPTRRKTSSAISRRRILASNARRNSRRGHSASTVGMQASLTFPACQNVGSLCRMLVEFHTLGKCSGSTSGVDMTSGDVIVRTSQQTPEVWIRSGGTTLRVVRPPSRRYCLKLSPCILELEEHQTPVEVPRQSHHIHSVGCNWMHT